VLHAVVARLRSIAVLSLACACVGSDPPPSIPSSSGGPTDAGGGALLDGGSDAARAECHWDDPFATPVLVAGVNPETSEQLGATLTADEKQIFFISKGASADGQVLFASRDDEDGAFGEPRPVFSAQDRGSDLGVAVNADASLLVLSSRQSGGAHPDLFVAVRDGAAFGTPIRSGEANSDASDVTPFLTADGASLLFATSRGEPSDANLDLYVASKKSGQNDFGPASPYGGGTTFLTGDAESWPVLSADGLTLYFARQPAAPEGQPTRIWRSHRAATSEAFLPPALVDDLNATPDGGAAYDAPSWISPDDCRIYLTSKRRIRDSGSSWSDIYVAKRQPRVR
jgi:hypothetical protein